MKSIANRKPLRPAGAPAVNYRELVMITVSGKVAHPFSGKVPYRIGRDGILRIVPGTGGVVVNHRVGDPCVGLAGDHVEPAVSLRNDDHAITGEKAGQNLALNTYACVGNSAVVLNGPCKGEVGTVTGKHGGVNHVLIDFPTEVLKKIQIGDAIQIYGYGLGMRFLSHPEISVWSCAPRLIGKWGVRSQPPRLLVPVTHLIPAGIMGSGLGRNNAERGDYDVQLTDPELVKRLRLDRLRFGDFVAIVGADTRFGRSYDPRFTTIGVIIHSDSTVSGHGPGVSALLTGPSNRLIPVVDRRANIAAVLGLRTVLPVPRRRLTLPQKSVQKLGYRTVALPHRS